MTLRRAVLAGPDAPGSVLPLLVAVLACLAAVATAGAVRAFDVVDTGRRVLDAKLTIHLPASDSHETDASRLQRVLAEVRENPAVAVAEAIPEAELQALGVSVDKQFARFEFSFGSREAFPVYIGFPALMVQEIQAHSDAP